MPYCVGLTAGIESQQIVRTMARSQLGEDEVRRIMAAQIPRTERLRAADGVLNNDAGIETLRSGVETLHQRCVEEARDAR